jgi:ADP-ribose pyrophosphatase YjhB (NUDIX family)
VPVDRSFIRVKAMLVAPDEGFTSHAVTLNPPTRENPHGYHRLIGGSVELGETHRDAIVREVEEELGATIHDLRFLYAGRLDPRPARRAATLTESDGSIVPVGWRPFDDAGEALPLYPQAAVPWIRSLTDPR